MDYKPDTFLTDEKSVRNARTDDPQINKTDYKNNDAFSVSFLPEERDCISAETFSADHT
jgi:hypothetical protein